ncbi:cell division control protein 24 [[Candida] anglica]|uniref:Cell division control protein 24 n=1 Tax=[Candida] anglica TaxID=148631 RepID=A0ABP0EIE5_9ASCO
MEYNHAPQAAFRSFSTSSISSSHSSNPSTASITRVSSGPLQAMNLSMNRQSSAQEHLYYQCTSLKRKLSKIPEMAPFLASAFNSAELCAEQQALALSQQLQNEGIGGGSIGNSSGNGKSNGISNNSNINNGHNGSNNSNNSNGDGSASDARASVGSNGFSIHSDTSTTSQATSTNMYSPSFNSNSIFTFTAGVLPATLSADPVTQIWKLFQQGSPLCLLFNTVYPQRECHLPVIPSEDLRICKKSVYDFLIAVKTYLKFDDENMFTISNVFSDSTHDLIKIVKVINRVVDEADSEEDTSIGEIIITDDRSKVLKEMIETERKYVQDLEILLQYKDELSNAELISNEQIHILFPNLNEIVDFQRRFLIGLECNNNVPNKYQRIGSIFIHAAKGSFKAYEPWTIGQLSAIDLINKESSNLKKSSTLLDPGFELQSYIIKPIQRLCKYPLLLKELIKLSSEIENNASYNELQMAQSAMKEVANQVNEAQRRAENVGYLQSLLERVNNWRGFNLKDQGELLHHGIVSVKDSDVEKEYVAYLFEKIIFFFVEINQEKSKESKKKNILKTRQKSNSNVSNSTANLLESMNSAKEKAPLELKGRVYISEIYNISCLNQSGYTLVISWSGKKESGSFSLRYRTEENRNQWETCLRNLKAIEMNNQIHRKLRDSHGSNYGEYDNNTITSGATGTTVTNSTIQEHKPAITEVDQRHHSSSSTFSMMRFAKSGGKDSSRQSSSGTMSDKFSSLNINDSSFSSTASSNSTNSNYILIKLIFNHNEVSELIVPSNTQFLELRSKISIKISSQTSDDVMINKLKYKDEDGDFVVMDSNDDWVLAVDMLDELNVGEERALTIWVS